MNRSFHSAGAGDVITGAELEIQLDIPQSRRRFLGRSLLASAAAIPILGIAGLADGTAAAGPVTLASSTEKSLFRSIQQHENDHVAFLLNALGEAARPKPEFQNLKKKKHNDFRDLAVAFENTGAKAYLGASGFIQNPDYLAAAASIALVEARHAGALNRLDKHPVTVGGESFESPLTQEEVVAAVSPYIVSLNGGDPPAFQLARSAENDIAILNFALLLEYLEAEFYNINVPKLY